MKADSSVCFIRTVGAMRGNTSFCTLAVRANATVKFTPNEDEIHPHIHGKIWAMD